MWCADFGGAVEFGAVTIELAGLVGVVTLWIMSTTGTTRRRESPEVVSVAADGFLVERKMHEAALKYVCENEYLCKNQNNRQVTNCSCVAELVCTIGVRVVVEVPRAKGDGKEGRSNKKGSCSRKTIVGVQGNKPFGEILAVLSQLVKLQEVIVGREHLEAAFFSFLEMILPDTLNRFTEGRMGLRGEDFWQVGPFCRWGLTCLLHAAVPASFEKFHRIWIDGANCYHGDVRKGEVFAEVRGKGSGYHIKADVWAKCLDSSSQDKKKRQLVVSLPSGSKDKRRKGQRHEFEMWKRRYYKDVCIGGMVNNELLLQFISFWVRKRGKTDKNPSERQLVKFLTERKCRLVFPLLKRVRCETVVLLRNEEAPEGAVALSGESLVSEEAWLCLNEKQRDELKSYFGRRIDAVEKSEGRFRIALGVNDIFKKWVDVLIVDHRLYGADGRVLRLKGRDGYYQSSKKKFGRHRSDVFVIPVKEEVCEDLLAVW